MVKNNISKNKVYCKVCVKHPLTVRRYSDNKKIAPIATTNGTRLLFDVIKNHFSSKYHIECKKLELLESNSTTVKENKNLIDVHINAANLKQSNHIGKCLIQVYTDAKRLTSSAYSWPARFLGSEAAHSFDFNSYSSTIPKDANIQYVSPSDHLIFLKLIAKTHFKQFEAKIKTGRAFSLHIDGSVDRTNIDKIYILLKMVNLEGSLETLFIGIGQQTERGAIGLFNATIKGINDNVGKDVHEFIMKNVSSICTDGENKNTGERNSFWTLFQAECKKYRSDLPLFKFWCSAHRMELVWGDLAKKVKEVQKITDMASSIASHFNESSMRLQKLKKIAAENQLNLLRIPKVFNVRWSEWTHTTISNLLKSWKAIVMYCNWEGSDATATGYGRFLCDLENMKLVSFLTDVLNIFKRYHKNLQSDKLTIVDLVKNIDLLKFKLEELKKSVAIGGSEEDLNINTKVENDRVLFNAIEMVTARATRSIGKRCFVDIRADILKTIIDGLESRFSIDHDFIDIVQPFLQFEEQTDIRKIHSMFGADKPLADLSEEFTEIVQLK